MFITLLELRAENSKILTVPKTKTKRKRITGLNSYVTSERMTWEALPSPKIYGRQLFLSPYSCLYAPCGQASLGIEN